MNHVACCFGMGGSLAFLLSSAPRFPPYQMGKNMRSPARDGVRLRGRNTSSLTCRSLPHVATGPDHISIYTTCVNVGQKKHNLKSISLFYNTGFLCQGGAKLRVFQQSDRAEKHSA